MIPSSTVVASVNQIEISRFFFIFASFIPAELSGLAVRGCLMATRQRRIAITDQTASTRPKGHAPCKNP